MSYRRVTSAAAEVELRTLERLVARDDVVSADLVVQICGPNLGEGMNAAQLERLAKAQEMLRVKQEKVEQDAPPIGRGMH